VEKNFALHATKKKYSNFCVVRKNISERNKKPIIPPLPPPPPLQVKWSVPKIKKKNVFACFIDLIKAFDTVWRKGLFFTSRKEDSPGNF
jgi:hypothetical protein